MDERERRIGLNEALFREVNERINDVNEALGSFSGVMEIVCECGDLACADQLTIGLSDYEQVRSEPTWFAVIRGHEIADVEEIVASHGKYDVVQKRPGPAAAQAEATDPR